MESQSKSNDNTLEVLYSSSQIQSFEEQKSSNSLEFWKQLVYTYCTHNQLYSIKLADLQKLFIHSGKPQAYFTTAVDDMIRKGEISLMHDFLMKIPGNWRTWAMSILSKKFSISSINKVKGTAFNKTLMDETFVHLNAIINDASKLLRSIPEAKKDKVLQMEELINAVQLHSKDNLKLLLFYLESIGEASIREVVNFSENEVITLVKIANVENLTPITYVDVDKYLQKNEEELLVSIKKLQNEINSLMIETKISILHGRKTINKAKNCMLKRRSIQRRVIDRGQSTNIATSSNTTNEANI